MNCNKNRPTQKQDCPVNKGAYGIFQKQSLDTSSIESLVKYGMKYTAPCDWLFGIP